MPNWCENAVWISHTDRDKIEEVVKAIKEERLLEYLAPMPKILESQEPIDISYTKPELSPIELQCIEETGYRNWYEWRLNKWGTRSDIREHTIIRSKKSDIRTIDDSLYEVHATFETAWSAPIEAYRAAVDRAFIIKAFYNETGWGFCGQVVEGEELYIEYPPFDCSDEYRKEVINSIPKELNEFYDIGENIEAAKYFAELASA